MEPANTRAKITDHRLIVDTCPATMRIIPEPGAETSLAALAALICERIYAPGSLTELPPVGTNMPDDRRFLDRPCPKHHVSFIRQPSSIDFLSFHMNQNRTLEYYSSIPLLHSNAGDLGVLVIRSLTSNYLKQQCHDLQHTGISMVGTSDASQETLCFNALALPRMLPGL